MPANRAATSAIGVHENPFAWIRLWCDGEGNKGHHDHGGVTQQVFNRNLGTENRKTAEFQPGAQQDRADDDGSQQHVHSADDANRPIRCRIARDVSFAPIDHRVHGEEQSQHNSGGEERWCVRCWVVQKKSTPRRKPRNKGGSPSGVSDPPMFDTRKIKNTTTCTLCFRSSLARSTGRIITMDAPVVPITLARMVPMPSRIVFVAGEPCRFRKPRSRSRP